MGLNFKKKYLTDVFRELDSREKKIFSILILLVFFSIFLELFSIALIIPLIKLFIDNSFLDEIRLKFSFLNNFDKNTLLFIVVIIFSSAYIFKTVFLSFLSFRKFDFLNNLISKKIFSLYNSYLNQKYSFHRNSHSSLLVKNLINEMDVLIAFYNAYLIFLSESLFSLIIFVIIFIYEPLIMVSLLLVIFSGHFLYKFLSKNRVETWSTERQNLQAELNKIFTETFGAIKEIIIYDVRYFFQKRIKQIQLNKARLSTKFSTFNDIPKFFLELFSLVFFIIISSYFFYRGDNNEDILIRLALLTALIFKLVPSFSRILNSTQQIKFYIPAHELIHHDINLATERIVSNSNILIYNNEITLNNIFFKYKDSDNYVLNNFSCSIKKGDRVLIIGESGKGKSTLLDIIAGFNNDFKGEILIDGMPLNNLPSWRKKIGYLSQSFFILDDTILNNIILNNEYQEDRLKSVIDICGLANVIDNQNEGINTKLGERGSFLSGGERQRIGLARAIYNKPEVLVLDEPTSSLDEKTAHNFISSIMNIDYDCTILMVSHNESFITFFNQIIRLS